MKKYLISLLLLISVTPLISSEIDGLAIIVAKDEPVESMTLDHVKEIFLKNDVSEQFVARDMNEGSPERNFFISRGLSMSASQLRQHWGNKMNQGYDEWPRKNSARAMVSFVSRGGRIGYVDPAKLTTVKKASKVKVVLVIK